MAIALWLRTGAGVCSVSPADLLSALGTMSRGTDGSFTAGQVRVNDLFLMGCSDTGVRNGCVKQHS